MGTRSLTHVYELAEDTTPLLTIYRQCDGYPSGIGTDIHDILSERELVNGISGDRRTVTNGMGCASALLVKNLKAEAGDVYIYPAGSKGCGEEYTYHIFPLGNTFRMKIEDGAETIFDGPIKSLPEFLAPKL